jgi:hypothetical protein
MGSVWEGVWEPVATFFAKIREFPKSPKLRLSSCLAQSKTVDHKVYHLDDILLPKEVLL